MLKRQIKAPSIDTVQSLTQQHEAKRKLNQQQAADIFRRSVAAYTAAACQGVRNPFSRRRRGYFRGFRRRDFAESEDRP